MAQSAMNLGFNPETALRYDFQDGEFVRRDPDRLAPRSRYGTRVENIPLEEAQREREERIKKQKGVIAGEMRYLADIKREPLHMTRNRIIRLNPGDPGYEEAGIPHNPAAHHGDWQWVDHPADIGG